MIFEIVSWDSSVPSVDIKLSPIPAALLAAISPITAMLWLLFTFALRLIGMIIARLAGSKRRHVAMAPFMAVAAMSAIGVYGLLANAWVSRRIQARPETSGRSVLFARAAPPWIDAVGGCIRRLGPRGFGKGS